MELKLHFRNALTVILAIMITGSVFSQVGINTTSPVSGAVLDIQSNDKGLLIPRVELDGTNDTWTITPSATEGLLVYNTVTRGALPVQVTPGFYYWNNGSWKRFYNQGYSLEYKQTNQVTASSISTTYVNLPGLDTGTFSVPFSGTYQIRVSAFASAGNLISTSGDGAMQGSISLWQDINGTSSTSPIKETYVTSSSKRIGGVTVNGLATNVTITFNVDLNVTETYRFYVRGRQWLANNTQNAIFGKNTSGYTGSGSNNNAQRGSMSVTLVKQQ